MFPGDGVFGLGDALVVAGNLDAQEVAARRKIGVVDLVVVAGLDPIIVEPFELVMIMHAAILAVFERGERNAEPVLVVAEPDFGVIGQVALDGPAAAGRDEPVVDAQVLEDERNPPFGRHGRGVEERKAVRTAEDERAVGQAAGRTLVELIAAQPVGRVVIGEALGGRVVFAQSVQSADPQIALGVLLDGRDFETGGAGHGHEPLFGGNVAQQSIADGADPDVAAAVLENPGGDENRAADALPEVVAGNLQLPYLAVRNDFKRLVERRHQQRAVLQRQQIGNERKRTVEHLYRLETAFARSQRMEEMGGRTDPDRALGILRDGHG